MSATFGQESRQGPAIARGVGRQNKGRDISGVEAIRARRVGMSSGGRTTSSLVFCSLHLGVFGSLVAAEEAATARGSR